MISRQLDILALEPFYGGVRRAMLETVMRCSRHRWTLLKLPPRRIERRLTAAAIWFAEQLSRHWSGRIDLLFTSEAMNLADLYRLFPPLSKQPSIVYLHDNQLPAPGGDASGKHDLVNLNSASAASELWFNSLFHLRDFLSKATALVERHSELSSRSPMAQLAAKSHLMLSPIDFNGFQEPHPPGDPATIFVETRGGDVSLLNEALHRLHLRGEKFNLITVGPVEDLSDDWPRRTISEADDAGQVAGLREAGIFLSIKQQPPFDYQAVRAVIAGAQVLLPDGGCYPELLPASMLDSHLYDLEPSALSQKLYLAMRAPHAAGPTPAARAHLKGYEALAACRVLDERVQVLAESKSPST